MRTNLRWLWLALGVAAATRLLTLRRRWKGFSGRVVLITGGSRGLGLVLAREFARRGARLALCARDPEELERARAELERRGASVFVQVCDVAERSQIERAVRETERRYGRIDVLVNNAGVIQVGPFETQTPEDFELAMRVHYWAALWATLAAFPGMRERGEGRIVNVASIGGKISVPHLLPYSASKFALVGLSEGLRAELVKDGIYVTTVCPGLMRTGSPRHALIKGKNRLEYAWFAVSGSLPLLSISAQRAARRVVEACRRGQAEVILSLPAQLAARLHGLFPALAAEWLSLADRLLPGPGGSGTQAREGARSESAFTRSFLTGLTRSAERRNNERPGPRAAP